MTSVHDAISAHDAGLSTDPSSFYHSYRRQHRRSLHRTKLSLEKLHIPADLLPRIRILSPTPSSATQPRLEEHSQWYGKTESSTTPASAVPPPIRELFISPHPDDICYSCFSTVSKGKGKEEETITHLDNGRVIVTVFSKSRCANGELGEKLNRNVEDITKIRKVEDETFAKTVGCKLQQLGLPDSSARDEFSRWTHLAQETCEEQHRVVKAHPRYQEAERALSSIVRQAVQCKAAVYMPLGVGCHVDHLMTRVAVTCILDQIRAETRMRRLPIRLTYYEDLPYAYYVTEESIQALAKNVLPSGATSHLIPVDEACWEKKKQAVLAYETQMKPVILPALHERASTLATLDLNIIREKKMDSQQDVGLRERVWTL